jgi:hypothetical protein
LSSPCISGYYPTFDPFKNKLRLKNKI